MLTEVSSEVRELARKMLVKQNERLAKMRVEIASAHPHALVDTLVFDEVMKKFKLNIKCVECGDTSRVVYTSDLHQVNLCNTCSDRKKEAKKSLQKAQQAAARRLISSGALAAVVVPAPVVAVAAPEVAPVAAEVPAPKGWESVETSCPDNTPEVPAEAPKKRKGGRPKGSKNKAK